MSERTAKHRARTADEKDARRASLIAAGARMLAVQRLEDIKIADLAAEAGVAKGTAYLYFTSKEALFLALLTDMVGDWFAKAASVFQPGASRDQIATGIAASFAGAPLLLDLLGPLHVSLEANASEAEILAYKRALASCLGTYGAKLEQTAGLQTGVGIRVFLRAYALAIGLAQVCRPPERVRRIMETDPALADMRPDFETELAAGLRALLA